MKLTHLISSLALIITTFTLSGCIKIDFNQTIAKDGSSHVTVVNDMSAIGGTLGSLDGLDSASLGGLENTQLDAEGIQEFNANLETVCDDFYVETTLENPTCVRDEYIVTLEGDVRLTEEHFTVKKSFPYITYQYNLANVYELLGETNANEETPINEESIAQAKSSAAMLGMEMNYALTMPAGISLTPENGIIDPENPNRFSVSLFEIVGNDEAIVEAQSLNWLWIGIVIAVGIVFIVIAVMILMMKMRRRKPLAPITDTPFQQ